MKLPLSVAALMLLQLICGLVLLWEVASSLFGVSYVPLPWAVIELIEVGAILGLLAGTLVSARLLQRASARQSDAEARLRLASGAFMQVVEGRFAEWHLSPAERDVAMFALKGLSIAEIAALRETSEGTVKAQSNAIYRKAGVTGRSQLLSLFIDDLLTEPALPAASKGASADIPRTS
ncbi:helix-turn-helix transcriptional regulator [Sagittula sp. SSi028]|uniref:helix-turn-helix transcriptional regulator n=1 Tax=Sagittula sp. SSi028 TaxID=3400636 RepID=UPI003AF533D1